MINSIENVQNEFSLHDVWRVKKLNSSLLSRPDYVDKINNEFPVWLEEAKDRSSTIDLNGLDKDQC